MKKFISTILLLTIYLAVQAHEFWLQPNKFKLKPGESIVIDFRVGENLIGGQWNFTKELLERVELHGRVSKNDLKNSVVLGDKENLTITPFGEGTFVLGLQSFEKYIKADGETFNKYLGEEGLEDAYAFRKKNNLLLDSAGDHYSRHSKLLIQSGKKLDDTFNKKLGFPVEIIPDVNPYSLKVGDRISFKVYYQGKPMFGARIKIQNRYQNRTTIQNIYSLQDGTIETTLSNPGEWLVSFVKMVPLKDSKTEWKSYWASLVFGI